MTENKINILDSVMGSGKTQSIINYINTRDTPIIIIVERQTEVQRLSAACPRLEALSDVSVKEKINRREALELKTDRGESFISTHQLFKHWSDRFLSSVSDWGYELIMDETLSGILSSVNIKSKDLKKYLDDQYIQVCVGNKLNKVKLIRSLHTKYDDVEDCINRKDCYLFNMSQDTEDPCYKLIQAPRAEMFDVFNKIKVLTYQFEGSLLRCYFDLHKIQYEMMTIEDGSIASYTDSFGLAFKNKVKIYNGKLNHTHGKDIGSYCWTQKHINQEAMKKRLRNIFNYWKKKEITPDTFLYTIHKEYQAKIHPSQITGLRNGLNNDYADTGKRQEMTEGEKRMVSFLAQTVRGTNEFSHKKFMAFMSNTYMEPQIKNFLQHHDISINEESYALNRVIQWLWRGCIRNNQEMHVFVPSKRMRHLLLKWLGYNEDEFF